MTALAQPTSPSNGTALVAATANSRLWSEVDKIAARAERLSDLRVHRLETVVAAHAPAASFVPAAEIRAQALRQLSAPVLLERIRAVARGTLIVVKGPELACLYPPSRLRPFNDVDLIVEDAERTQRQLLRAGFVEIGEKEAYRGLHHLRPLLWPGSSLFVEVHSRPKWPAGHRPVSFSELAAVAVPAAIGVAGIDALPRPEHAVLVAAHGWAHDPLARLLVLVDVALLLQGVDRSLPAEVARHWGVERLWRATETAVDVLFDGGTVRGPVRTWARALRLARERTVLEAHLARTLAPFSALPFRPGLASSLRELCAQVLPAEGERWRTKSRRTMLALRDMTVRGSDHDAIVWARGVGGAPPL